MPTLAPGCIVTRTNPSSTGSGVTDRNMIVTQVRSKTSICLYARKNKEYGYVFREYKNSELNVVLDAPAGSGVVGPPTTGTTDVTSLDLSSEDSSINILAT